MNQTLKHLRTVHPFPARMVPAIIERELRSPFPLRIVDPMAGSGTTVVAAKLFGHKAIGFDTDPLALLIAKTWATEVDSQKARADALSVHSAAIFTTKRRQQVSTFPDNASEETKAFIDFWFDQENQRQLTALANAIAAVKSTESKNVLWCALSRMIITKGVGVSLGADISHSRPHRVYKVAPVLALDRFLPAVEQVLKGTISKSIAGLQSAKISRGDSRSLPLKSESTDLVITSPPYLNAIDYLRGHKLSLVWMGYQIEDLRTLRSKNIGTENTRAPQNQHLDKTKIDGMLPGIDSLPTRTQRMIHKYFSDMNKVLSEINRILVPDGRAVLVIANSIQKGVYVNTSEVIANLAEEHGLKMVTTRTRPLQENRRYLPPPSRAGAGQNLQTRMKEEVIVAFRKP